MRKVFISTLFLWIAVQVHGQESCQVLVDSLKGTYEGGCNKGKAEGEGKARGADAYEGSFKNGLPDGTGKYTWKNGDYYFGQWKKGIKEGKGEMHTITNGADVVTKGFWKKGEYKGQYEKPYAIYNTTTDVGRVEISKIKGSNQTIRIEVQSLGSNNYSANASRASLTDIRIQTGSFNTKVVNKLSNKEVVTLQAVIFPFKAIFVFGTSTVEVEFFEEGEWSMFVPIQG